MVGCSSFRALEPMYRTCNGHVPDLLTSFPLSKPFHVAVALARAANGMLAASLSTRTAAPEQRRLTSSPPIVMLGQRLAHCVQEKL